MANQQLTKFKEIFKDLLTGALSWTSIFDFLNWHFFRRFLDDEITLVSEK